MADLSFKERNMLEKLFNMGGGYVLGFSNRTFQEFVADNTGIDIFNEKYNYGSGSKANRLRAFWNEEPNHVVAKLNKALLEYSSDLNNKENGTIADGMRIVNRLHQSPTIQGIDEITLGTNDRNFETLKKSIKEAIDNNLPEAGLDRLHTFVIKCIRILCDKHGLPSEKDKPLNSLFGGYIKYIEREKLIESEMSTRIMKYSISILDAFNDVRNNWSLAHDNNMLNYEESILIFNNICGLINFIDFIEYKLERANKGPNNPTIDDNDLPF